LGEGEREGTSSYGRVGAAWPRAVVAAWVPVPERTLGREPLGGAGGQRRRRCPDGLGGGGSTVEEVIGGGGAGFGKGSGAAARV